MAKTGQVQRKWYVLDAEGKTLGALAVEAAVLLRGKHKPIYTPHVDTGDFVIVVNAEKVELTGSKDGYFKVSAGERILGGFSYPGPGVSRINFTIFAHDKPWGKAIEITKLSQLVTVITELAEFLGLDNTNDNDE